MYKLSGHSLTRGEWFVPESQALILTERGSTSTITLGPTAPAVEFNDWLYDDEVPGGAVIWRVKSCVDIPNTNSRSVDLEHVIKTLDDRMVIEEANAATILDDETAENVTAKKAIQYLLSLQEDWVLGDFEFNTVSNPYEFYAETVLDEIESVTDTLENALWEYDLTTYPFKLHIRKRPTAVTCEMRQGRNLTTMRKSINRGGMYTRLYPIGDNDLRLEEEYLSENENVYGRIEKIETNMAKTTEDNLRAWAEGLLRNHCEPEVSISISGLELSEVTGEPLDTLRLNRVCRCPLPEHGTTIVERIVKLQWRDRIKEPEVVMVTLANNLMDISEIVKKEKRKAGGGGGAAGQAKKNWLFEVNGEHLLYEIFDDCGHVHGMLRMTSESLRIAFDNSLESLRSEFLLTAESLRIKFENDLASLRSEFLMTAESLRIAFWAYGESIRSEFLMTAESLRIRFENDLESLRSEFLLTAESLRISFWAYGESIRSEFLMTAESLRIKFDNDINSTRSEFLMTAESLRISFENDIESARSELLMTAESMRVQFENDINSVRSEITVTAESLRTTFENDINSTRSMISVTSESLRTEFTNENESLRSAIQQEAGRIGMVVEGYGENAAIKRAAIILTINGEGGSEAHIDAAEVYIGNSASTTVIAGKMNASDITASYIRGLVEEANVLEVGSLTATNFHATDGAINSVNLWNLIHSMDLTLSGNTYTLSWKTVGGTDNTKTFSRATSLSGAWSSNTYTVTASPQGNTDSMTVYARLSGGNSDNFSAEACSSGSGDLTSRNSVRGDLYLSGSGSSAVAKVKDHESGTDVAQLSVGGLYTTGKTDGIASVTAEDPTQPNGASMNTGGKSYNVYVRSNASNGAYKDKTFVINTTGSYNAGQSDVKLSKSWSSGTCTISKGTSGSNSASITVSATAGITYNSGAHTYTASAQASADSSVRASDTTTSGTEAYTAGKADGAAEVTVTDISLWDGDTQLSGTVSIGVGASKTVQAWCKRAGTWMSGTSITVQGPYLPDTGSWSYDTYQGKFQPKVTILGKTYYSTYLYSGLA